MTLHPDPAAYKQVTVSLGSAQFHCDQRSTPCSLADGNGDSHRAPWNQIRVQEYKYGMLQQ